MNESKDPKAEHNSSDHRNNASDGGAFSHNSTTENNPSAPTEQSDATNHSKQAPWWQDKHFVVQLLIFATTVVIACIYRGQLHQMNESNSINSEGLQSVQRSLVNFGGLQLGVRLVGPPDGKTWLGNEIAVAWANGGNTPAKSMVIRGNVQAWRGNLPEGFGFPENNVNSPAVIGPKSVYGINVTVSKTDLLDAWRGNSRIFFWGSVLYKDVFKGDPDRLSEFCAEMTHVALNPMVTPAPTPTPGQPVPGAPAVDPDTLNLAGFQWQACKEHNCYDDDCKDYASKVKIMREQ
jgi:hypothetical protein